MGTSELARNILDALINEGILSCGSNGFIFEEWIPVIEKQIDNYNEANYDDKEYD